MLTSLLVAHVLSLALGQTPCLLGEEVLQGITELGASSNLMVRRSNGNIESPTNNDFDLRIDTQDPNPGTALPAQVVVTLHPYGAVKPTYVPCLVGVVVLEAKLRLGDIKLRIKEGALYRFATLADGQRTIDQQMTGAGSLVPRPGGSLPPGYFVAVVLHPLPPPDRKSVV